MKKTILLIILFLSSSSLCLGMFSLHVNITPSINKTQEFKVTIKRVENGLIAVRFPWINGNSKYCWLIVFNEGDVPERERNFRNIIWWGRSDWKTLQYIDEKLVELTNEAKRERILHLNPSQRYRLKLRETLEAEKKAVQIRYNEHKNRRSGIFLSAIEKVIALSVSKDRFIEFELEDQLMDRSFVVIDFPSPVLDGGFYYTIDLPEFWREQRPN